MKSLFLIGLFILLTSFIEKEYVKKYYSNGKMKEEGWLVNDKKSDYWFYYFETGDKKEEGHYYNNQKTSWWIYYDKKRKVIKKCEYKNNVLNGLTIIYKNGEIVSAEEYTMGKKIKSWKSLSEFKKDNINLFN